MLHMLRVTVLILVGMLLTAVSCPDKVASKLRLWKGSFHAARQFNQFQHASKPSDVSTQATHLA